MVKFGSVSGNGNVEEYWSNRSLVEETYARAKALGLTRVRVDAMHRQCRVYDVAGDLKLTVWVAVDGDLRQHPNNARYGVSAN